MNLGIVVGLIGLPLASAALLLLFRSETARRIILTVTTIPLVAGPLALGFLHLPGGENRLQLPAEGVTWVILGLELAIGVYLVVTSLRARRALPALLVVAQVALMTVFELTTGHGIEVTHHLVVDRLAIMMAIIVGVVGSLVCIYALGYMRVEHAHAGGARDRRPGFFSTLYLFLSAMFGVIFANDLIWLFFSWEITTLCSFLLIRHRRNEESVKSAYRALTMNLAGGLAFALGIVIFARAIGSLELSRLLSLGPAVVIVPAALLAVAGMTKAAQLPFTPWLLGAMVAPTPVSALLHSSTMVKAGVYLVLRLAPVMVGTLPGTMVALVGGFTFLAGSLLAISQSDSKKILAYSTVANLGLIVLCGGVGTAEALWAGVLLMLFHAVAKALLFLCVGTVEHRIGSRDVEAMSGLIVRLPRISILMQIGMAGMFLAPFGMLISKYAVLKAMIDYNPLLAAFLVFGGGATVFFWVKWMGKLLVVSGAPENRERETVTSEWMPLLTLAILTVGLVATFPVVSRLIIEPYVRDVFGSSPSLDPGNLVIMIIMLALIALFPLTFVFYGRKVKVMEAYLAGANADSSIQYTGAMGRIREAGFRNYYLEAYLGEKRLLAPSIWVGAILFAVLIGGSFL